MRVIIYISFAAFFFTGCRQEKSKPRFTKLDNNWLDSIMRSSDSSYTKPYFRTDFVTASYYFNKKDSSLCQIMKDSQQRVRQISISVKNIRSFYGQYYTNGQLQAWLTFDEKGQYHGDAWFYYESGRPKSSGIYTHGIKTGEWKNYGEDGKVTGTDVFDKDGQLQKTIPN